MEEDVGVISPTNSPPPPIIEIEKEFILALEALPYLWDKSHSEYLHKYKRNQGLQKLLLIFKRIKPLATIEDVRKKINILRSNYRRELKKVIASRRLGVAADEVYSPKSWTFPYLHFLEKFVQPVNQITEEDSEGPQETELQRSPSARNTGSISSLSQIPPLHQSSKRIKKSSLTKQNEVLDCACAYLKQSAEPQKTSENSIAIVWAETLNALDPTQRIFAKKAINDVLFEAELGNLQRHSVQISHSHSVTSSSLPEYELYSSDSFISTRAKNLKTSAAQETPTFSFPNDT